MIYFSFNYLYISHYKINLNSSVWKWMLCQDSLNYNLGCLINVNMLNWKDEAGFVENFVLIQHGAFLKNIFR